MEIVDLYDRQKRILNKRIDRYSSKQLDGEYMQTVHIWIINSKGELLIQKRSTNKPKNPGKWACTAGAVDAGETSLDGAKREVKEELGLELEEDKFDFLISFKREFTFIDVWLIKADIEISDIKLQEEEVDEAKWISINELEKMLETEEFVQSIKLYYDLFMSILEKYYNINK